MTTFLLFQARSGVDLQLEDKILNYQVSVKLQSDQVFERCIRTPESENTNIEIETKFYCATVTINNSDSVEMFISR